MKINLRAVGTKPKDHWEFEQMIKVIENEQVHIMEIIENESENRRVDWFDELSDEQQKDILEGLGEADGGETVPHSEVVKLFGKWGLK